MVVRSSRAKEIGSHAGVRDNLRAVHVPNSIRAIKVGPYASGAPRAVPPAGLQRVRRGAFTDRQRLAHTIGYRLNRDSSYLARSRRKSAKNTVGLAPAQH